MVPQIIWQCPPDTWLFIDITPEGGETRSTRLVAVGVDDEGKLVPYEWQDPDLVAVSDPYVVRDPK